MKLFKKWRRQRSAQTRVSTNQAPVANLGVSRQVSRLGQKLGKIDAAFWQQFERDLIAADLPAALAIEVVLKAQKRFVLGSSIPVVRNYMCELLVKYYGKTDRSVPVVLKPQQPNVFLVVGVNGVGKTTTIAKLAHYYHTRQQRVLLVAADTFRAGAVVQLQSWAQKLAVTCVTGVPRQTPASVVYQGLTRARHYDVVLIDTAGRLHNKVPLMQELQKMNTVIVKQLQRPADAVLLVMDAQVGGNAMAQAKQFIATLPVTGIILTKTDSTAKGGAAITLSRELNLPIRWMGTGENVRDLVPFQLHDYVTRLVGRASHEH